MATRWIALAAILAGAGCSTEKIHVRVLRPAAVNLGKYNKIAVDIFTGNGGTEFAADLTAALSSTTNPMTGQTDFDVLDRRDVDRMLDQLRRQRGRQWNEETMGILEEWKNAEIIVKGNLPVYSVTEDIIEKDWVDPAGYPHKTFTRRAVASVSVVIEATDTSSGRTFDSVRFDEVASDSASAVDSTPPLLDGTALLDAARGNVVHRYLRRVIPHEDYVQIVLYKSGKFPELSVGNGFARSGTWDDAINSYQEALDRMTGDLEEYRYMALYNMGVALQYTNRFSEARQALKEAYARSQDDRILRQIERVSIREQEFQQLLEQSEKGSDSSLSASVP